MILALILVLINIRIFMAMKKTQPIEAVETKSTGGEWTVYGSMDCGWTRKQLEYFKGNGMPHTFVDCDSGDCKGIEGYPTMVHSSGERVVGFKEVGSVKAVKAKSPDGEWTVYGSMGCGWTRKQLEYFKGKGKPYTFVDCDSDDCKGIEGYPTMVHSSGERVVGFKEV